MVNLSFLIKDFYCLTLLFTIFIFKYIKSFEKI